MLFLLALSTGQCTETVKASGRPHGVSDFPQISFLAEKGKAAFPPGKFKRNLPSTACRICYLCSAEWGGFCWRNISPRSKCPRFFPPLHPPAVSQAGKLARSSFPLPHCQRRFCRVRRRGACLKAILSLPSMCPNPVFFCACKPGSWELQDYRFFFFQLILHQKIRAPFCHYNHSTISLITSLRTEAAGTCSLWWFKHCFYCALQPEIHESDPVSSTTSDALLLRDPTARPTARLTKLHSWRRKLSRVLSLINQLSCYSQWDDTWQGYTQTEVVDVAT